MSPTTAIALALSLPLAAVLFTCLLGRRPNLREGSTVVLATATFATLASLARGVFAGVRPELDLFEVLPGLEVGFAVEPLGMLFALVASFLWIVTTFYSIGFLRTGKEENQTRFFAFFAVAIFAAVGAALSANLFTLFLFYEVLTLSTYPLVTHRRTEEARRGGRVYLGILLFTSITFLLFAVVWTWLLAGTLDFTPGGILAEALATGRVGTGGLTVLLALFAFGTGKAALMPFHRWLPRAMVAPAPVSALLHAVAVVKAGVFTVLKVVVYIFGLDLLERTGISVWLMYVAGATLVLASLVALTKDNLKARLAYSTISQLSYIVLGAALANSWGILGGGMHIAMHAFGKITLFFCAGVFYLTTHQIEVSALRGIGRRMPVTTTAFLLGSLSIIGLPPFGGAWSKWYLALGAAEAHQGFLLAALMVSSLLNIAYLIPIPVRGFFLPPVSGPERPPIEEGPVLCVLALSFTALASLALFFYADEIFAALRPIVT